MVPVQVCHAPVGDALQPLPFLRQETGFTVLQPSFHVWLTDADILIDGSDVHVADHENQVVRRVLFLQVTAEVSVELLLVWKLGRMTAVLALREVSVDYGDLSAVLRVEGGTDKSFLIILCIGYKPPENISGRFPVEQGDAIVGFLTMVDDVVTEIADLFDGEVLVRDLGLLQTDEFGIVFVDNGLKLVQAYANAVDIE